MTNNTFAAWVARYRPDPVLFVQEVLGADPDEWQRVVLGEYGKGTRLISIRSAHGPGKTVVMSWCALHQILCHYPQKTVATAPTSAQLFDALASEMKSWITRLPPALRDLLEVKTDRIDLKSDPNGSFISFRTSRAESPEAMQGIHSDRVLLLPDEASGIPEAVFVASVGSMSGANAITIAASNPTRSSGFFYDTQTANADQWFTVHVCADVPEASPTAFKSPRISAEFVEYVDNQFGRDSVEFQVRVLGEFPRADLDSLIPFELIDGAKRRDVQPIPNAKAVWGLDVGGKDEGGDLSVLAKRMANVMPEKAQVRRGLETMEVVGWVKQEWDRTPVYSRPAEINVDAIGIGAGVASRLREMGLPAQAINVSESRSSTGAFLNLRAELWQQVKEWFLARDCYMVPDDGMERDLLSIRAKNTSSGKLQIESKDAMRKRTKRSPDRGDAFMLTFAGPASFMQSGWSPSGPWNTPIRRNLPGVY